MVKKYDIYKNDRKFEIRWSKWLQPISNDNLIVTNIRMNNFQIIRRELMILNNHMNVSAQSMIILFWITYRDVNTRHKRKTWCPRSVLIHVSHYSNRRSGRLANLKTTTWDNDNNKKFNYLSLFVCNLVFWWQLLR